MNQSKKELVKYLENMGLFIIGAFFVLFPLLFLSTTTDAFVLPKQMLLIITVALFTLLFGLKTIVEGKLKLRNTPFDIAVIIFLVVTFASTFFSINRYDSFTAFVPLLFVTFLYFGIVNFVRGEKQLLFIIASLVTGASLAGLLTVFSFFKIYPLPFAYTHVPFFTTFGSLLDHALYLGIMLPIAGYFIYPLVASTLLRKKTHSSLQANQSKLQGQAATIVFSVGFILIAFSFGVTSYLLATSQKPLILPFSFGLQTAFAAISQDPINVTKSFLLGSGVGTYLTDFARFKPATYNLNPTLWSFTFFRSSSYILELLATVGLLGVASYLFIIFRVLKEKNFFPPLLIALLASLFLPFSFSIVTLLFVLLAIFASVRVLANPHKYGETDIYLVTLKKGLFKAVSDGETVPAAEKKLSRVLPATFFLFLLVAVGVPFYFVVRFFISDITFQQSLVAASQNNGLQTYNLQISAINTFPYRDLYYRGFSQTNLALANALAKQQQQSATDKKKQEQNPDVQKNILQLIQQSIDSGRTATNIAPLSAFNWNNLSSIYRSLIGFGENAGQFTVLTAQQAIALDPNNPQQYVELGGIYYQLGQYDDASRQFQIAISLKKDYANAYYNLGHTLEAKGDLQTALALYQTVQALVTKDKDNNKKIDDEIDALKEKIKTQDKKPVEETAANVAPAAEQQQPLTVNKPEKTLPERDPQVKIPEPSVSIVPSISKAPAPTKGL
jgi:tetratricopeptide (TPR) repeat protein